jgi:diaminohydroxyphosphoribosylaminopyrimidine deaminase / 5-amino-6-(5-phosphoribosylamino)uracil reductase
VYTEELTSEKNSNNLSSTDLQYMKRALELAKKGKGQVSPGPLVGCVLVGSSGKIVGEGFYLYEGIKHAETIALEEAGDLAKNSTAYITLEPHAHQGRTPPCTDALLRAGVARVVAPIEDPNPKVMGQGFRHLRDSGVQVDTGLMAREAELQNEKYIHFMKTGRPFLHLKLATSLDGKIATHTGESRWITGEASRVAVHGLRHEYDAILIGSGTAIADDPLLTDRSGLKRHKPLCRIVLDRNLKISTDSRLVKSAQETPLTVITSSSADRALIAKLEASGVKVATVYDGNDLGVLLDYLSAQGIQSLLIEGGTSVAGAFLDARLINKVTFFMAPMIIGGELSRGAIGGAGVSSLSDALKLRDITIEHHGEDLEITGYPS